MSERMNGRDPSIRRRNEVYFNERPGIGVTPSNDYLKRRQSSELFRRVYGEPITLESTTTYSIGHVEPDVVRGITLPSCEVVPQAFKEEQNLEGRKNDLGLDLLPIDAHEAEIVDIITNNRVSIFIAETGSGKTTRIPQFLIKGGIDHVYISEPRRATVDGPGARVQEELDIQFGEDAEGLVETIHGGRAVRHEASRITFATAASLIFMAPELVKRLERDETIAVLVDEIHENDQYTEAAFGVMNYLASQYPGLHIVCMSATIDENMLKTPLARVIDFENPKESDVPVMHIKGRPFTYTAHEVPDMNPAQVFLEYGARSKVFSMVSRGYDPMRAMIDAAREGYEAREPGSSERIIHRNFSGKVSTKGREEIVRIAQSNYRDAQLVITGTPAMQSGVTIPGMDGLAYDGMINREVRRPDRGRGIVPSYASKAEVIQFFGRAGRDVPDAHVYLTSPMPSRKGDKAEAEFHQVYPFMPMSERPDFPEPGISGGNLAELLLLGASAGVRPEVFNKFIRGEQERMVLNESIHRLQFEFNAIDEDGAITEIGRIMGRFPMAPELSRGLAEAVLKGRTKSHLARMAIIAASVDTGGLQRDGTSLEDARWKAFLRSGSTDDFIAQYDFWGAFREHNYRVDDPTYEGFHFAVEQELDYSRYLSTQEPIEKSLRRLGVDLRRLTIEPPSYSEIKEMREDFTAGMYGLTYRETREGKRADDKNYYFDPIVDHETHPRRTLVPNSVLEPRKGEVIAGMPTFKRRIRKGHVSEVELLGNTLKVSHEDVGRYARAGGLVDYQLVPGTTRIDGEMVRESIQGMFGSMKVGSHMTDKDLRKQSIEITDEIPVESQRRLITAAQQNPGEELRELRHVAETLAEYRRLLPLEIIDEYRYKDAPADVTLAYINNLLANYAGRTRSLRDLDKLVGEHAQKNALSVNLFYSSVDQQEMLRRSPEYISLGPNVQPLRILYANGRPYATNVSKEQLAAIHGPIYIDEGFENPREVMHQIKKEGRGARGTRRVSFGSQQEG